VTEPVPEPILTSVPDPKHKAGGPNRYLSFVLLTALLGFMAFFATLVAPGPLRSATRVVIAHGTNVRLIAEKLYSEGAVYHPVLFRIAARLFVYNALQAGEYQIEPKQSIASIVLMIHGGHSIVRRFTVAEGLAVGEIIRLLNATTALDGTISLSPAEGSLLPETYLYSYGDSRNELLLRMQKSMQEIVNDEWSQRDASVPVSTPEQAIIMASVVEKETGKASERPRIAGVFYNRLRTHMRLQSDPTVIYAITQAKGFLDHDLDHYDLAFASPINTYVSDGLPSQPICNPGRAAIQAVLHPETNDYLYFVADGTGGHVFARNLAEHNQNVTRWNQIKNQKSQ